MSQKLNFPRRLRLKSYKQIAFLFSNHQSLMVHPVLVKYHFKPLDQKEEIALPLFGVAVPKRQYRSAADRNLIKRRIREAYRIHWQNEFLVQPGIQLSAMYIMIGKTIPSYELIELAIRKSLSKLNAIQKNQDLATEGS